LIARAALERLAMKQPPWKCAAQLRRRLRSWTWRTGVPSIGAAAAKNFYYGFAVLPRRKESLSAVYAFMRACDDISRQQH